MPRAKANPDPAVVEVVFEDEPKPGTYVISAYRDGSYFVNLGEKVIASAPSQLHAGFGAPHFPSNSLQEQALKAAKNSLALWRHRA
jgi:hypothetical protein